MASKLTLSAFNFYVELGDERSYASVAAHYGVTKRTIVRRAKAEHWPQRLREMEAKSRAKLAEQAQSTLDDMNEQHLKLLKFIRARAVEALKAMSLTTPMDAVRSLDMAIRNERTIMGEPTDRTAVSIEDTIKREYERWMPTAYEGGEDVSDE